MSEVEARPAAELERALEHRFADPGLLETALVHASRAHETGAGRGNERLEFLGDAVVNLLVAELLYDAHPEWSEGELTRSRAALVNRESLAECARALSLGPFILLGRTEQRSAGEEKGTILADCFEAVVGALYLDAGLAPAAALLRRLFADDLERGAAPDPKTAFQEWAHARLGATPRYRTVGDSGGEADEARFRVEVAVGGEVFGEGVGRSKRVAERRAARAALERGRRRDA